MPLAAALHEKAVAVAKLIVRMTSKAGSGHPSSALSIAHLVVYLMFRQMRYDPANPWDPAADRLVLSEGHAAPAVYAAYALLGGAVGKPEAPRRLTEADVDALRARDSVLDGHPNPAEGFPFFDAATGSLGQGLSVAAGLALAARGDGLDRRFYVVIGDGEAREGQIWEAADFVVDHQLTNVCALFNCNGQGQAGLVSPQQSPQRLLAKLRAFGWDTTEINGHEPREIELAFKKLGDTDQPLAIVARTVKGWGVDKLQDGNWHGKPLPAAEIDAAYASLDATLASLHVDTTGAGDVGRPPEPARPKKPALRAAPGAAAWPAFEDAMRACGFGPGLAQGRLATRHAYGAALKIAGDLLPQVAALDGDVSNSTFAEVFRASHPERFFECKIAEQNMVSVAAGLAAAGYIPFASSFAKFIARAYDQIELASISRANVKLVGSHAGISPSADGPSQMGLLDVAFFRALGAVRGDDRESPLCWSFQPSDALAAYHCTRLMTQIDGLCYLRTHRPDVPLLYPPQTQFEPGGFHTLRPGGDLAIVSAGYMTHVSLRAVDALARQSVRAALLDVYSTPVKAAPLAEALARAGGVALVVEDNYGGGLGAEVAEVAAGHGGLRVRRLHVQRVPRSTRSPEEILEYCGVSDAQIADHALALLRRPDVA